MSREKVISVYFGVLVLYLLPLVLEARPCEKYEDSKTSGCILPEVWPNWPENSALRCSMGVLNLNDCVEKTEAVKCQRPATRTSSLALFDVDGTLTDPRSPAKKEMISFLKVVTIGFVGGSNLEKQIEQLGDAITLFDFMFPENGLVAYHNNELVHSVSIAEYLGESKLKTIISVSLYYIAELALRHVDSNDSEEFVLPFQRGTFFEYRTGLLNISPVGRNLNSAERQRFRSLDEKFHIREQMVSYLKKELNEKRALNLHFALGGQISIDVFPAGWDKTYCLGYFSLTNEDREFEIVPERSSGIGDTLPVLSSFNEIHFFGDKTSPGGNDFEIYMDQRVIGHAVKSPEETMSIAKSLFLCPDLFETERFRQSMISLRAAIAKAKAESKSERFRLGFTASSFDLLHPGHMLLLADARAQCDFLVAGLQTDPTLDRDSKNNPIQSIIERRIVLESNRHVDFVVEYATERDVLRLAEELRPDVRILGTDWNGKYFTGYELPIFTHWHERNHSWSSTNLRHRIWEREEAKRLNQPS